MIEELARISPFLQTIVVPIVGYGAFMLKGIRDEFRKLNGRLGRLEQWKEDHVEQTHEALQRDLDRLERDKMNGRGNHANQHS